MKLGIFTSFNKYYNYYINACKELNINYEVIDIIASNWMELIQQSDCDGYLCRPPSLYQPKKIMYDERLYIINKMMGKTIYPSFDELLIYENKRMMAYWLELNKFPHPRTHIFYRKEDYFDFLDKNEKYPLVFKLNVGGSAKGVKLINSKLKAKYISHKIFGLYNQKLAHGYTPAKTGFLGMPARSTKQFFYILVQEYEKIKWEWRMIKIGDSYFGHQKLLKGNFASGSGRVGRVKPPDELLHMVKDICEKGGFYSMDADIFETQDGRFLVNELQSLFGSFKDAQMHLNGVPGRFIYKKGEFLFEQGVFNQHGSSLLRVKHFVEILNKQKKNMV